MQDWIDKIITDPFAEFAIIFFLAAIAGIIGQFLKQPILIMFIVLGILVGPSVLNLIQSTEQVELLAEIGISILLFIVGLKLDLKIIQSVGKIALLTGMGQVIFTSVIGWFIGYLLGYSPIHSLYIAIALTFSSTIIIVKLLTDKKEIDSLHGQIAIGFLIVQDIVVILIMIILTGMGQEGDHNLVINIALTFVKGIALTFGIIIIIRWIMKPLSTFMAKSGELLLLFSVAWALILASFSHQIGFSSEVGAFLGGVSLASTPFREAISSRLTSIRDFLLLFFFINLGASLDLTIIGAKVGNAVIFSLFVLIGNPIIVLIIMGIMGYRKRTSFLAGLTVAQISEFSLLFAAMGLSIGHINEEVVGLITLVGLITIGLSTYLILYSFPIFTFISPILSIFERKSIPGKEIHSAPLKPANVLILGYGRLGKAIANSLKERNISYLAVDSDPYLVSSLQRKDENIIFGDVEEPDFFEHLQIDKISTIISTIKHVDLDMKVVKELKQMDYQGRIILTATNSIDQKILKKLEVHDVIIPYEIAGKDLVKMI
jgi:Kef-type K+ transport system membrane component KefB